MIAYGISTLECIGFQYSERKLKAGKRRLKSYNGIVFTVFNKQNWVLFNFSALSMFLEYSS